MTLIARLADRVLGGESPTRCLHCRFDNAPGATSCQVCGTVLEGTRCSKCDMVNPSDATVCGLCGFRLLRVELALVVERTDIRESVAPRPPRAGADSAAEGPSPAALIGFGAVLSLAAAAYPWYLFGGFAAGPEHRTTLSQLLEAGWEGFPGVPLTLIAIAAVTSTMVSVLKELEAVRPAVAVVSGLVTLISATWLSEGFERMQTPGSDQAIPITGGILVTIGAIVVLTSGLYLWNYQRTRASLQTPPHSPPRTTIPLEAAPPSTPIA